MADFFSHLSGDTSDMPTPQVAPLDSTTTGILNQQEAAGLTGQGAQKAQLASNIQSGKDTYNSLGTGNGLMGQGIGDAIKQKYGNLLGNSLSQYGLEKQQDIRGGELQRMQTAQAAYLAQQGLQNQAYEAAMQAQTMRESARAQALGSVFGAIGTGVGMAAAKSNSNNSNKKAPHEDPSMNVAGANMAGGPMDNMGMQNRMNRNQQRIENIG